MTNQSSTGLAIATHLLALITGFIAPLIILLASEDEFTKNNAREALNWQISIWVYLLCLLVVGFIFLLLAPLLSLILAVLVFFAIFITDFVLCIIATVKAAKNKVYSYPLAIPFLKQR